MEIQDDPNRAHEYLADRKFSQKINCPRTEQPVSFADIGDPEGCPVLFIPSSACSRWSIIPEDQMCRARGIRLIVVDRPGCGATPTIDVKDRFETSSFHILSVLDHLDTRPRHLVTTSSGIYYTLHLLIHHAGFFPIVPQPVFISPWVPPSSTAETTISQIAFTMMPGLTLTQDFTGGPGALKLERATSSTIDTSKKTTQAPRSWTERLAGLAKRGQASVPDADTSEDEGEKWRKAITSVTIAYMLAEESQGIGQEMMICLDRGPQDTGREWLESAFTELSARLKKDDRTAMISIWWGLNDPIVPRKAQLWLNKLIEKTPRLTLKTFDFKDAGHTDLIWRGEGLARVFAMYHFRERVYYGG